MSAASLTPIGTVAALLRFPVKSMRGEALTEARLGWHGIDADRRYALQRLGREHAIGLPWASARQFPGLLQWVAHTETEDDRTSVVVTSPDGSEYDAADPVVVRRLADELGEALAMTHLSRGTYDAMDVSLITTRSVASIEALVGRALEVERFRPNIVIETGAGRAFPEDKWVGKTLVLGHGPDPARLRVNRKDPRCMIIDLDPTTGQRSGDVFGTVVRERRNLLGAYATVERCGTIAIGDTVSLRSR